MKYCVFVCVCCVCVCIIDNSRMKVVQFNIYFGECVGKRSNPKGIDLDVHTRMKNLSKCLIEEDADVVCMQEVLQDMFGTLCDLLGVTYPYVFPSREDGLTQSYGTVIMSKHPIKKCIKHKYEFTNMGRDLKMILINPSGYFVDPDTDEDIASKDNKKDETIGSVFICTTHFESEFKNECTKKNYQYKRCEDILRQIHNKTKIPIIFCADTNVCRRTENKFHEIFSHEWRDAWIENDSMKNKEITFDSLSNPILIKRYGVSENKNQDKPIKTFRSRLDRILHISDFHSNNFKLIGTDKNVIISDHYGISCTFQKVKPVDRIDGCGKYVKPINFFKPHVRYARMFLPRLV